MTLLAGLLRLRLRLPWLLVPVLPGLRRRGGAATSGLE